MKKTYYGNKENKIKLYSKNCKSENDVNFNKSLFIIKNCIGVKYKSKFCVYHYENYKDLIQIKIIIIFVISIKHFIITLNIVFIYIFFILLSILSNINSLMIV